MAKKDERRRQRIIQKKRARRNAAQARSRPKPFSSARAPGWAAASSPVHECLIPDNLFNLGIGNIIFSRRLPSGQVCRAVFLLDIFCLGVKDALYETLSRDEYEWKKEQIVCGQRYLPIEPSCARKLTEGAVQYAEQLGLPPHPDYQVAKRIFADIDVAACAEEFVYGQEGKPFYIAGPNDTPEKSRQILNKLEKVCGPDGFHFMVPQQF